MIIPIYLNRHFPKRLSQQDLNALTLARVKAYNKKHSRLLGLYKNQTYHYSPHDIEYNGNFGTNVEMQINEYFSMVRAIIKQKQIQGKVNA